MCGFVGFIDENDQTYDHRATIVAMANAIAHRGPDSEGYFSDGRAALGFRRLAIIDLAGAAWYMVYADIGWGTAFLTTALPFLPGDLIKCVAAVLVAKPLSVALSKLRKSSAA